MPRYSERNLPTLAGTVSMTRVKNQLKKEHPELVPTISNVRINGQLQGCSGFITDPASGRIVYISTDSNHGSNRQAYFRTASHLKDYTGGRNHFCSSDDIVTEAVALLKQEVA